MKLVKADKNNMEYIKNLYKEAFPWSERKPFFTLTTDKIHMYAVDSDDGLAGMVVASVREDVAFVDYLAVDPAKRGNGIGSAILALIKERYKGYRIFLEIEDPDMPCDNRDQRERRQRFYFKNGFEFKGLKVHTKGLDALILCIGGEVTFEEYKNAYIYAYGKLFTKFLNPKVY